MFTSWKPDFRKSTYLWVSTNIQILFGVTDAPRVANVQRRNSLEHLQRIFWIYEKIPLDTDNFRVTARAPKNLALKGSDEGDSLSVLKSFGKSLHNGQPRGGVLILLTLINGEGKVKHQENTEPKVCSWSLNYFRFFPPLHRYEICTEFFSKMKLFRPNSATP